MEVDADVYEKDIMIVIDSDDGEGGGSDAFGSVQVATVNIKKKIYKKSEQDEETKFQKIILKGKNKMLKIYGKKSNRNMKKIILKSKRMSNLK